MAGTTTKSRDNLGTRGAVRSLAVNFNKLVDDVETVRVANRLLFSAEVDPGSAGTDITARAVFVAPVALTILDSIKVIAVDAITGVDGSNTLVLTLRNITEGVDIATLTRTATSSANAVLSLTRDSNNADIAANDVIGVTVTQGATADAGLLRFQFEYYPATADAAADLTAAKIGNTAGTAFTV